MIDVELSNIWGVSACRICCPEKKTCLTRICSFGPTCWMARIFWVG